MLYDQTFNALRQVLPNCYLNLFFDGMRIKNPAQDIGSNTVSPDSKSSITKKLLPYPSSFVVKNFTKVSFFNLKVVDKSSNGKQGI